MKLDSSTADDLFAALADPHRRAIVSLVRNRGPTSVSALHRTLAERGGDAAAIRIGLHHDHLPRLADVGLVEYNPDTGWIEPTPVEDDRVETVLEIAGTATPHPTPE